MGETTEHRGDAAGVRVDVTTRSDAETVRRLVGILRAKPRLRIEMPASVPEADPVSAVAGRGGRRRSVPRGVDREATRALRETLGEPTVYRRFGMRLEVFEVEPDGDGAILVRLSSRDVQKGETALGQVTEVFDMCRRQELRPRKVLVMLRCEASATYEKRFDWAMVRDDADSGWLRWVALREADRISRNRESAPRLHRDLELRDIGLYLAVQGRAIDLGDPNDRFLLDTFTNVGTLEAATIRRRTQGPIINRWLLEGRGWPKQPPFGFRRDTRDYVEVDPEQWAFVERIHGDYATLDPLGGGSIRRLRRHLAAMGCALSVAQLQRILRNPMYVSGEWSVTYGGKEYPCQPVRIASPIPDEVFQRNGALLDASRGKQKVHPIGFYALNTVRVVHGACAEDAERDPVHLMKGKTGRYRHIRAPHSTCRGFTVERSVLDSAVIGILRELCESPERRRQYAEAARPGAITLPNDDGLPSEPQTLSIEQELRLRKQQLQEANRQWLARPTEAAEGDLVEGYAALTDLLRREIAGLERRLLIARRLQDAAATDAAALEHVDLVARAHEILTVEPPADPDVAQRRVAFIQAAIDEVVVDIDGDELVIEIKGALVDRHVRAPLEPLAPALAHLSTPADCLAGLALRDSPHLFRARGECSPGWRSPPRRFPLPARQRRPRRHDDARVTVIELLRTASASAPAGPVAIGALAETDMARNLGLTVAVLRDLLSRRFGGTPSAWREALGGRDAVALGRAAPRSADDWAVLVTRLIDLGFEFDRGWQQRWDKVSRTTYPWLPREPTLRAAERTLGFQFFDLVDRARTEDDGPVRRRRPTFWRPSDFEDCLRAIVETDRTTPIGRLRFADLAATTARDVALPDVATIKYRIYDRGLTLGLAVRAALGVDRALRRQRVRPVSGEEWAIVIAWAIDARLDLDRPWGSWPEVMRRTDFLPDRHVLYEWLGKRGFSDFVREVAAERGQDPW